MTKKKKYQQKNKDIGNKQKQRSSEDWWRLYNDDKCTLLELLKNIPDEGYREGYKNFCDDYELDPDDEKSATQFVHWYEAPSSCPEMLNPNDFKDENVEESKEENEKTDTNMLIRNLLGDKLTEEWVENLTSDDAVLVTEWRLNNPNGSRNKCREAIQKARNIPYLWWEAYDLLHLTFEEPHTHIVIINKDSVREELARLQGILKQQMQKV